jgi:hypothetical protein
VRNINSRRRRALFARALRRRLDVSNRLLIADSGRAATLVQSQHLTNNRDKEEPMTEQAAGTSIDRLIVAAVMLLIAAFALTVVTAFTPFASADDRLAGNRDSGDDALVAEEEDDGDGGGGNGNDDTATGTTQGTGPSNTATNDTATGTQTQATDHPNGNGGNNNDTATGTTQGTGPSNTATNDTNTGTHTVDTATGTTQGTGPSNTATNDTATGTVTHNN